MSRELSSAIKQLTFRMLRENAARPPTLNRMAYVFSWVRDLSEEEAHEVSLVSGAEEDKQGAGEGTGRLDLAPEPAADGAVDDGGVVKQDECGHGDADAVDGKVAGRHEGMVRGKQLYVSGFR